MYTIVGMMPYNKAKFESSLKVLGGVMDTLNNHVVAFGPMLSSDRPRVIALS